MMVVMEMPGLKMETACFGENVMPLPPVTHISNTSHRGFINLQITFTESVCRRTRPLLERALDSRKNFRVVEVRCRLLCDDVACAASCVV